ncbi:hypothetical protein EV182_000134 [Spiromyces aspiralis]|uniref:Uncharacterized protein n=1 Tax=Spiromyces aspiralis TaxID=68401 RepID=A0ACC1HYL4_9FUNG|nr:hypothetical protein EV182_000134 [Spiromyces aspiralis]
MGSVISTIRNSGFPFGSAFNSDDGSSQGNLVSESRYAGLTLLLDDKNLSEDSLAILNEGDDLVRRLEAYRDCSDVIHQALSDHTPENEAKAWREIADNIIFLRDAYNYSTKLEAEISGLLGFLSVSKLGQRDPNTSLEQPRLEVYFTKIIQFAFKFDRLKMKTGSLQNDFSYYRRTLSRLRQSEDPEITRTVLKDGLANHMSLFYAYPNPMFRVIINSAVQYSSSDNQASFLELLVALKVACTNMLRASNPNPVFKERLLTLMTACCIIYDWTHPYGVFTQQSSISMPAVIGAIRQYSDSDKEKEILLDAIRIHSKHAKAQNVPRKVRSMLGF